MLIRKYELYLKTETFVLLLENILGGLIKVLKGNSILVLLTDTSGWNSRYSIECCRSICTGGSLHF